MAPGHTIKQEVYVQFAFDNSDFNVSAIDGYGTFHNITGIQCVTPPDAIINYKDIIVKQKRLTQSTLSEKKGTLMIDFQQNSTKDFHQLTMYCGWLQNFGKPGWQGFLETITHGGYSNPSAVITLPLIVAPPSKHDTIHTSLLMALDCVYDLGLSKVFVPCDLPLYMKAVEITLSAPPDSQLNKIAVRLGDFHLVMSFLGSMGYIMADSGLHEILETIYAEKTVKHILIGHAYARAIHGLVATGLRNIILDNVNIALEEKEAMENSIYNFSNFPPSVNSPKKWREQKRQVLQQNCGCST